MDTIITIQSLTIGLLSIGIFFIKKFINEQDKRWEIHDRIREETAKEVHEMKVNYLDRFKDVSESISDTKILLHSKINETEKNILEKIIELKKNN